MTQLLNQKKQRRGYQKCHNVAPKLTDITSKVATQKQYLGKAGDMVTYYFIN